MSSAYLWVKALHIVFVASWFAGLFYLPRIFVNLAQIRPDTDEYRRLLGMAQRLKRFMLILMLGTLIFGSAIMLSNGMEGFYLWLAQKWLWAKTALVLVLFGYDGYCSVLLREFVGGRNRRQHVWWC